MDTSFTTVRLPYFFTSPSALSTMLSWASVFMFMLSVSFISDNLLAKILKKR